MFKVGDWVTYSTSPGIWRVAWLDTSGRYALEYVGSPGVSITTANPRNLTLLPWQVGDTAWWYDAIIHQFCALEVQFVGGQWSWHNIAKRVLTGVSVGWPPDDVLYRDLDSLPATCTDVIRLDGTPEPRARRRAAAFGSAPPWTPPPNPFAPTWSPGEAAEESPSSTLELPLRPTCECGAKAMGAKDYSMGHSSWCPVSA